jgi:hypothetical protein
MTIKLKYLIFGNDFNSKYDWESLRNSIKINGFNSNNDKPIKAIHFYREYYFLIDGNHRVFLLKELYDEDYEIDIYVETKSLIKFISFKEFIIFKIFIYINLIQFIIKYHKNKLFI